MEKYQSYSIDDFINDPEFQDWVFNKGGKGDLYWQTVKSEYPEKADMIEKSKMLLSTVAFREEFPSESKIELALKETLAKIENESAQLIPIQRKRNKFMWWAAAAIVVIVGSVFWVSKYKLSAVENEVVAVDTNDVKAPDLNKAIITLNDGRKVYVDSIGANGVTLSDNLKLVKLPTGEVKYVIGNELGDLKDALNTVTNPKGSKVLNIALSDGTKVWLNAGSSITYPISFFGSERKVDVSGEVYLEVAHNKAMPFKVTKGSTQIQVLGTRFNVNAYDDEDGIRVTLLEGSVNVSNGKQVSVLKPSQQAHITTGIKINDAVDVDVVMAWKDGFFAFSETSLEEMMKQISRWYDVRIVYEGTVPERYFGGKIQRENNLSVVLKILEESNIHYRINGRELVILK